MGVTAGEALCHECCAHPSIFALSEGAMRRVAGRANPRADDGSRTRTNENDLPWEVISS
jgi:hypothetical protein